MLGCLFEIAILWFAVNKLYKPLEEFYFVIFTSVIYWLIVLFSKKLNSTLLYLSLFLFPFNRFLILRNEQACLLGRISDYLLITIHLFEIPLYTLFSWKLTSRVFKALISILLQNSQNANKFLTFPRESRLTIQNFFKRHPLKILLFIFVFEMVVSSYVNKSSLFVLIPTFQLLFVFVLTFMYLKKVKLKSLINIFYFSSLIQSIISIFQITLNHSVGLHFLGESKFNSSLFYIAKTMFGDVLRVRAYGTFPHPNILGGFIFLSICLFGYDICLEIFRKDLFRLSFRFMVKSTILSLSILTLYLTQSRTAILALILAILTLILTSLLKVFSKKKTFSIFLPIILAISLFSGWLFQDRILSLLSYDQSSVSNRIELADVSMESVRNTQFSLFFGNGPDGFLKYLSEHKPVKTYYSFIVEPVHNVFLLFLSNFGVLGLIFLIAFSSLLIIKSRFWNISLPYSIILIPSIFFLFFSLNLDHYLVTLKQGIILLVVFCYLVVRQLNNTKN